MACPISSPVPTRRCCLMQLLAANVMNPAHIDVVIDEVNGLDHIVEELVSSWSSSSHWPRHSMGCRQHQSLARSSDSLIS